MKLARCFVASLFVLAIAGCGLSNSSEVGSDAQQLSKSISTQLPFATVKWEIFSTPESSAAGGPTDYVSLVAEFELQPGSELPPSRDGSLDPVFVVPEAKRIWLSKTASQLMAKLLNQSIEPSKVAGCQSADVRGAKSGRRLSAFICKLGETNVLYVNLLE